MSDNDKWVCGNGHTTTGSYFALTISCPKCGEVAYQR